MSCSPKGVVPVRVLWQEVSVENYTRLAVPAGRENSVRDETIITNEADMRGGITKATIR